MQPIYRRRHHRGSSTRRRGGCREVVDRRAEAEASSGTWLCGARVSSICAWAYDLRSLGDRGLWYVYRGAGSAAEGDGSLTYWHLENGVR